MPADEDIRDEALIDLEESPYLRRQKQVEVRRSRFSRRGARFRKIAVIACAASALFFGAWRTVAFGLHDERFRLTEDRIEVVGVRTPELQYVSRRQVVERFGGDIGRSIFAVPLERRRAMLEEVPWIEAAMVTRAWPDRIRVRIRERLPVAFLRSSGAGALALVDADGVLLDRPPRASFTFPVITGFSDQDPPEARRRRMRLYLRLIEELDADGAHHSLDVSEVDLGDPENARVVVARDGDAILLHLGNTAFLTRYQTFLAHIREWRQQFERIRSVDLRYERQIVVNPDRR